MTEFSPTNPDDYRDCSKAPTEGAPLHTKSGVAYDFKTKRLYYVTVAARDPSGLTDSIEVTVALANDEGPTRPEAPAVTAGKAPGWVGVSWTAPHSVQPITGYDLPYKRYVIDNWTDGPQDQSGEGAQMASPARRRPLLCARTREER